MAAYAWRARWFSRRLSSRIIPLAAQPPIRVPFYYGWVIVAVCFVSASLSGATSQLFMAVMVVPMAAEMGWTRTEASFALTLGVLVTAALSPVLGRLADRFGPRAILPIASVFVAGGFFGLAALQSIWQYYLSYSIGRGISQASLSGVVSSTAVTNWFRRYRGRAVGIYGMAFPVSNTFLVPIAQLVMSGFGWRAVFVGLGVLTLLLVIPGFWLLRRRPEDVGLLPDGATAASDGAAAGGRAGIEHDFTVKEAMRTPTFWFLVVGQFLAVLISGSASFHLFQHYADVGVSAAMIAFAIGGYALTNGLSMGLWGYLAERISERVLGMVSAAIGGLIIVGVMFNSNDVLALVLSTLYGFAVRGEGAVFNLIIARYYGRASFGAISGTLVPIGYVGLGVGPPMGSLMHDASGSYASFLITLVVCHMLGTLALFFARAPKLPARGTLPG
ncbi:MAG: MFS transporter [Chloroflexota bacterium]